ncbi:MAG: ATP-dependent helicase, partial [Faecalimonas sp.]|nr:ATP-dependent helicase [Faecalimonas sp.]
MAFDFGNANEAQRSAISTTDGPLLIIAGPGTGKTYTLVKRIVYLITEKNVLPEEIMIATFTEKAAKELITRITNELYAIGVSVNLNEMYIGTFHSICLRILKDHLEYTRIKKNYRMLDSFDQQYMVFQRINRFRSLPHFEAVFENKQGAWRQAGEIVKYVNNLAEELVDVEEMMQDSNEQIAAVANIMEQYNILMEDENLIDFSSIQTEAYKLLIEQPAILEDIQEKIKYVMVDEYQDTNYIQELLVFLIAGKNKNICVVGDDDQGLYRFRGATIRNILEFPGHFEEVECKQVKLVTNYRSERQIIDFYNKWMSTTDGRAYDFLWKNFRFDKKIVPPEGKREDKVSVIKCSGQELVDDWYEQVYSFIKQMKNSGVLTDYNQIAVLCRSVKGDKVTGMIEYLEEHDIKVYSPRSEMFFERKEIKQVIGCMLLCFPEYIRKLQQRDFAFDFEKLYEYYDTQCIAAAKELILQHRDTLGKWIAEKMQKHANIRRDNADYAFTGLLYQMLQ